MNRFCNFSIITLLLLCLRGYCIFSFGKESETQKDPYVWKQRQKYYYPNLDTKLREILNDGCLQTYVKLPDSTLKIPSDSNVIHASSFPVDKDIKRWWETIVRPRQMRVEHFLCDTVYSRKRPIFNNTGCQLPTYMSPSAPRCQTSYLKWICDQSRMDVEDPKSNSFVLPESDHSKTDVPPTPWIVMAKNAFVSMCGQIHAKCGLVHTNANCMATGYKSLGQAFQKKCSHDAAAVALAAKSSSMKCATGTPFSEDVHFHKRVFVVAEVDDTYVYHIHLEIMPRIIYHLDFLLANPDVKILVGCDSKKGLNRTEAGLAHGLQSMRPLMKMAGLSMDRLIVHTHVYAEEVYLPMEGGCQDPVYNTWQILTMRKKFMDFLNIPQPNNAVEEMNGKQKQQPVILLMKRSSGTKHTRNGHDSVRQWNDAFTNRMLQALKAAFPRFEVRLFSDKNETLMSCHECQIRAFAETDLLIGIHGAGLSNMLYMKPNSAVVEIGPYGNDGRCLLGGGPFSRMAAVLSHNYMIHHPPYKEYKWIASDLSSEFNIERFTLHVRSFLSSIQWLDGRASQN